MSSFKRRVPSSALPGTRPSPYNSLPLLSTGLSSLDDLFGGGLPLSSSLLIQSDKVTSYAGLLLKFFVAQGLECQQQHVVIVGSSLDVDGPQEIVDSLMDVDGGAPEAASEQESTGKGSSEAESKEDKLKIAFRYEGMKKHATTVETPTPPRPGTQQDTYCSLFDLTSTRALRPNDRSHLTLIDVEQFPITNRYQALFERLETIITQREHLLPNAGSVPSTSSNKPSTALRIAMSNFGSPSWGQVDEITLFSFLNRLRPLLRRSSTTVVLTYPAHQLSSPSILTRLSHASDAVISLTSFASSPTSMALFPRHAGLLHVPKLPSLGSLTPPSAKLSVLRGLGGGGEGREANLGFRVKRRRFIIETLAGEDVVGGPPGGDGGDKRVKSSEPKSEAPSGSVKTESKVRFAGEQRQPRPSPPHIEGKEKRSVSQIMHKQPELYEF